VRRRPAHLWHGHPDLADVRVLDFISRFPLVYFQSGETTPRDGKELYARANERNTLSCTKRLRNAHTLRTRDPTNRYCEITI
jgi:hypothetical protein